MVRLQFYADKDLVMKAALKEVFRHTFTQGEFEIAGIVDILDIEDEQGFHVKVDWAVFDEGDISWGLIAATWDGAPQFVKSKLRKLRLDWGGAFAFAEVLRYYALSYWCLFHLRSFGLPFGSNGDLGYYRVGHL